MQRGDEEDAVLVLQLVVQLTLGQERGAGTIRHGLVSSQVLGRELGRTCYSETSPEEMGTLYINMQV